jgi:hypothetical protein
VRIDVRKIGPILELKAGMKSYLTILALLSSVAVGCSDRGNNAADPNQPPAATAPAENPPPPASEAPAASAREDQPACSCHYRRAPGAADDHCSTQHRAQQRVEACTCG